VHVGGDHVHRYGGLLEVGVGQRFGQQLAQRLRRAQRVAHAHRRQQAMIEPQREHGAAAEALPQSRQVLQRVHVDAMGTDEGGVHRTRGGADQHVRADTALAHRLHHADLDRREAAAAGEHECCRHGRPPV
jgi:hypothetical protein